jgi:hypothetical protein
MLYFILKSDIIYTGGRVSHLVAVVRNFCSKIDRKWWAWDQNPSLISLFNEDASTSKFIQSIFKEYVIKIFKNIHHKAKKSKRFINHVRY